MATELSAGLIEDTSFMSLFSVKIGLTELGVAQYEQVIGLVFGFIALLNEEASLHEFYNETKEIHHTEFRFQHKNNGPEYATLVANHLAHKPLQFILNQMSFRQFDFAHIQELVACFQPSNAIGYLCTDAESLMEYVNETEPVYDLKYGRLPKRCEAEEMN